MLCQAPFTRGGQAYPCGQCLPCRINKRRVWTHRIMLESLEHPSSVFVTLTYGEKVPVNTNHDMTLVPKDLQDFMKRLRKAMEPVRIRFFAVGEYGDENQRPHYHAALFNFPKCVRSRTLRRPETLSRPLWKECCTSCRMVGTEWKHGDVDLGTLETGSAQYLAGYVTKKMTSKDDVRLYGRYPEFARMSNRPGIGAWFMDDYASTLMEFNLEDAESDVPSALRHGKRLMPLGRYLRRRLRSRLGKDEKAPQATLDAAAEEMRPLLEAAKRDAENPSLKSQILKSNAQQVSNMLGRRAIFERKKKL